MVNNAYIHIPFCVKKCNYCAFVSYSKLQLKKDYINALIKEIKSNYNKEKLKTLYFGGGTPSLLTIEDVNEIISQFNITKNTEITFEVNPNKLKLEYLAGLKNIGINRLSIGAQVFDNDILKSIGRLHSTEDILISLKNAREVGFDNISIDLIYGFPNQTLDNFKYSLKESIKLDVEHISLYGLKIEEGTEFYKNKPKNIPDDDMQADMYLLASDVLTKAGYEKYEISNFSKKGKHSKHNLNYWDANTYYGFGCGAHGYQNNIRYENQNDIEKYIKNPQDKLASHELTLKEQLEEKIFLGFRKASGVKVLELKDKFKYDFEKEHNHIIKEFIKSKHIIKTPEGYAFSDIGFLLSNEILYEFLD